MTFPASNRTRHLLLPLSALALAATLLWLLTTLTGPAQAAPSSAASATTRYVAPSGDDSRDCTRVDFPCATIQRALDVATAGDLVKVAGGVYDQVVARSSLTQVVYIQRDVTIEGGYNSAFSAANPTANPTTVDAKGLGRGVARLGRREKLVAGGGIVAAFESRPPFGEPGAG